MDIVIFDVGKTLVRGTHKDILLFLYKKGKVSLFFLLHVYLLFSLHKRGWVKDADVGQISRKMFNMMVKGWGVDETREILKECFEKAIKPKIIPESVEVIRNHVKKGDTVVLLSAFIGGVIESLKEYLDLKYAVYPNFEILNNKYTGKVLGAFPYAEGKVVLVKELILREKLSFHRIHAYADRFSDHFLFEFSDYPHVVNPDENLHKLAKEKGWEVHIFNKMAG